MSRQFEPSQPSIPEQIWAALKVWALLRARDDSAVNDEEAAMAVKSICKNIAHSTESLKDTALEYYAREAQELVHKERS